jgi:hypothetical protein
MGGREGGGEEGKETETQREKSRKGRREGTMLSEPWRHTSSSSCSCGFTEHTYN